MSGLLDKASAAKKAEEAEEVPKKKELDGKAVEMKADGKIRKLEGEPNAHLAMQISLAGWVIILVGALLSLQGGSWGLAVVSVVLVIGIGAIVYADRMKGSISKPKLYASLVVALLVAAGPYVLVMVFPSNANIAVTDIGIDEANDELDFAVRGTFNSVDLEIVSGGEVLWSGSETMTSNIKRVNVPIADFFDGNSESFDGTVLKTYTIKATSSNGNSVEMDINSNYLTRQAQNGGVQFSPYVTITAGSSNSDSETEYEGIRVQAFVGLFEEGERAMDDGVHSYASSNPRPFIGQQTYELSVSKQGSGDTYNHPVVTIDGDTAKWTSTYSGPKSSSTAVGFVPLSGTAIDNDGFEYVEKEEFYDGDGCYDFTLTVTNVNLGDDHSTTYTITNSWEFNWESSDSEVRNSYPTC